MPSDIVTIALEAGGSFLAGLAVGYFLRVAVKLLLLATGAIGFILAILAHHGVIEVHFDRLGEFIKMCLEKLEFLMHVGMQFGLPFLVGLVVGFKLARRAEARETKYARADTSDLSFV